MSEDAEYRSPFSWRYGSPEMRRLWSEEGKHRLWRRIWAALARVQSRYGLVSSTQLADIEAHLNDVDLKKAAEIEAVIRHDLMSELKVFASQAAAGGSVLHLGATSMDIEDNADAIRIRQSLKLILDRLSELLLAFSIRLEEFAGLPVIAYTHLQPAEPTTLGYRLAFTAQELLEVLQDGKVIIDRVRGKGFKGAVGTGAAYAELVGLDQFEQFEKEISQELDLPFFPITHQTYPRRQDFIVLNWLAACAGSLHKFAFDLRLLQSPQFGELSESFGARQVGSSAMPFKRNPINSEKIDSLARAVAQAPRVAWDNFAGSLLERTLDDSANRRSLLPEAFLAMDELLLTAQSLLAGLVIDHQAVERNLTRYAPFAATERILLQLTRAGADRLEAHEKLRQLSLQAWQAVASGGDNPLAVLIAGDEYICGYLKADMLASLMDIRGHTGIAEDRSRWLGAQIRSFLNADG